MSHSTDISTYVTTFLLGSYVYKNDFKLVIWLNCYPMLTAIWVMSIHTNLINAYQLIYNYYKQWLDINLQNILKTSDIMWHRQWPCYLDKDREVK